MKPSLRWSIAAGVIAAAIILTFAIPVLAREPQDRVAVRSIPHRSEPAPQAQPAQPAHPPIKPAAAEAAPVSLAWTLPPGWTAAANKPMRVAVFAVPPGGECGLFLFAGGGDRLANVNRWRGQAGLAAIDAAALDRELTAGACAFGPFSWLKVRGDSKAFLAAMLDTPGGQCFAKLEAPADQLDAMREGFLAFCGSLRPAGTP